MSRQRGRVNVGVCGGGIGGLTAAIALARGGSQVTVLEAAPELGEIGAGIQMTPNVARLLVRYGVSEIIGDDLVQCDRINMRGPDGSIVGFSDFKSIIKNFGFPWWVVRRDQLLAGLAEGARRHGVNVVTGARVDNIQSSSSATGPWGPKVTVKTEKGQSFEFDFVVGADGLRSTIRTRLFPAVKPTALTMNAAYRAVIPYDEVFAKIPEARELLGNNIDVWMAPGSYLISYPMTAGRDFNMVLSHHTRDGHVVVDAEDARIDELRDSFSGYEPTVRKIVALINESKRWPLLQTGPMTSWTNSDKNIVLMGDAAHSMVNHMAQGAATSMEDGAFLGKVIAEVGRGILSLTEAVNIYEKMRMVRAWTKQQASFTNGEIAFLSGSQLQARDTASRVEAAGPHLNPVHPVPPPPSYRSWNIWGYADGIPGVYAYDAEGDADSAVCDYLAQQGPVDPNTRVSQRLREKWWSWSTIEATQGEALIKGDKSRL